MPDLDYRTFALEIMDDFDLPPAQIDPVLEGLGKMNAWFGGHKSIIHTLRNFPVRDNYSITDWGCGGGDVLIAIAKWGANQKYRLKLKGIDAAPAALRFAREQSWSFSNISYTQADVIEDTHQLNKTDVIVCSLFTHHFNDEQWVTLVKNMQASARKGIIITDLHRHPVLYYAVMLITHVFTRNKMARNDGPLSVRRGFKRHELLALLQKAQINNFKLTWRWPFRWELIIYKS